MRSLDPIAVAYLLLFGFLVPLAVIRGRSRSRAGIGIPPFHRQAISIVLMELFFLLIALSAARAHDISVFARGTLPLKAVLLAAVVVILGLATLPPRWNRLLSPEQKLKSIATRPQKPGDLVPWFAVSLAAGVVEEIVYRGVLMAFVMPLARNWWLSVAICVLFFCLGHFNQPVLMVALVLIPLTVALHLIVAWTGSLYLAMATHFIYDFSAGFLFIRIARRHRAAASIPASPAPPLAESSTVPSR